MEKRLLTVAVGMALVSGTAMAAPFNSFDPRSMAMGGAGVAAANPATAPFFNPATLSVANKNADFAMELPIVGVRAYDPKDLASSLQDFQDNNLVQDLKNASTNTDRSALAQKIRDDLKIGLSAIDNKPVQAEVGAATVIGIPSKQYGVAFVANVWGAFGGKAVYAPEDKATLTNIIAACDANQPSCVTDAVNFADNLKSNLAIRGISLAEVGVSLAREFKIQGIELPVAIGITPKYVKATTIAYTANVDIAKTSNITGTDYIYEQNNINLDIGAAQDFRNGWRGGVVVKNLIPQEYKFKQAGVMLDEKIKMSPQARVGATYQNSWFLGAVDLDLTENDPVSQFEDKTRYLALGAEFNALDWAQLRLGYRVDAVNSDRNVVSGGVGLSPFGVHIDLGVAGNSNEIGAAAQFGFRF